MKLLNWIKRLTKHPDETYVIKLDIKDPQYTQKYTTAQSISQMSDSIRENKRDTYNIVSFYFMMFLTLSLSIFFPEKNILGILILGILLIIILFPKVIAFHRRRMQLSEKHHYILEYAKSMGLLRKRE